MKCHSLKQQFEPYADLIIFAITLLVSNYAWKWTFTGDEWGDAVTWLGYDVTAPFEFMSLHVARMVYGIISLFRDDVSLVNSIRIVFDNGVGTSVVWGCSGLKQSFIWLCLMLTVRGGWKHKLWYIPVGWACSYFFNIIRIALIAVLIEHHPDWFVPLHDYLFRYAYYAMFFVLWWVFVEKLRSSSSTNR